MRTNPAVDINTNWQINGIVKPGHVNALTRSIKYDYVVTAQMLEGKTGTVDVDELLGGNKINGTTGEVHVLINTMVPDNVVLHFPASSVGGPTGTLKVHVHTIGPFTASIGTSGIPYIHHYFHTHGPAEAVTFTSLPHNMHVGAFILTEPMELMAGASFIYEMALAELPFLDEQRPGTIAREAWMSNAIGGGGDDSGRLIIGDYSPADNYSIGNFVIPGTVTNDGLSPDKAVDMSEIHSIKWMPGSIACHTRDSSESLVLKGTVRPYSSSLSCPIVYHGGGSNCRAILIEGSISGGIDSDLCVTGSVSGKVTVSLNDVTFSTTTNGGFSNATVTYNGTTYTGESGGWSSEGTVSGSMGSGGYTDATIKSISVSAPMSNGGIQSNAPTITGSFGGGPGAQVIITFEYNGYEGTIVGEITSGGFTVTMPKIPAITCGFNSDGGFSYTKDASGTSGSLSASISSGGTHGSVFYLPVLYLNTSTMAEDRLYSIRIEYMYDASKDGELPLNRSLDYDAITVPARAGIWTDFDNDGVQALPFGDPSTQNLHSWNDSPCSCVADSVNPQFKIQAPETDLCAIPYAASGWFSPNDANNIRTWSWGRWYYNESDGSLTVEATKTINETLYTIKVFIIGSHHESLVTTSSPYFKLFAVKPSENTRPITKRSVDGYEHRGIIPPRMFALDDVTGIPECDDYHVPQWVGEVYLMKRSGLLYAWGP